ncbi:MAG: tRNA (adenosine(37)-N6)-threonylcarbamoyltransferase complex transferase subunit TsaD, partial [Oscillospiraceae bacterium]
QKGENIEIADVGASFINAVVKLLVRNTKRAIEQYNPTKLVLAGGVSANSVLRECMFTLAKSKSIELYLPELSLCGDNAAMVGAQAYYEYINGKRADSSLNAAATMSIEE